MTKVAIKLAQLLYLFHFDEVSLLLQFLLQRLLGIQNVGVSCITAPLSVSFIPLIIPKSEIVIQGISGSGIDDIKSQISFGLNETFIYYHFCPGVLL